MIRPPTQKPTREIRSNHSYILVSGVQEGQGRAQGHVSSLGIKPAAQLLCFCRKTVFIQSSTPFICSAWKRENKCFQFYCFQYLTKKRSNSSSFKASSSIGNEEKYESCVFGLKRLNHEIILKWKDQNVNFSSVLHLTIKWFHWDQVSVFGLMRSHLHDLSPICWKPDLSCCSWTEPAAPSAHKPTFSLHVSTCIGHHDSALWASLSRALLGGVEEVQFTWSGCRTIEAEDSQSAFLSPRASTLFGCPWFFQPWAELWQTEGSSGSNEPFR